MQVTSKASAVLAGVCLGVLIGLVPASGRAGEIASAGNGTTPALRSGDIVLRVDSVAITLEEFQDRLNLVLRPGDKRSAFDLRQDLAASLIAEKLLAAEAKRLRLETLSEASITIREFEREAVYEKLMDDEILSRIRISEADLRSAYARFTQQRTVRYREYPDSLSALRAAHDVRNGKSFDSLQAAEPAKAKTIEYAEALPAVEDAVYALRPGQASNPVNVDGTFYLFELVKSAPHPTYSTGGYAYWRPALERRVKARMAARRLAEVVPGLLANRAFEINRNVYNSVVDEIVRRLPFENQEKLQNPVELNKELAFLPPTLKAREGEAFMHFSDGSSWSVGDVWQQLRYGPYLLNYSSPEEFRKGFGDLLRRMVVFETFVQRGYARGLERTEYVKKETRMWRDDLLSRMYMITVADSLSPSQSELRSWYGAHASSYQRDETRTVMELIAGDRRLAESLIDRIRGGEDMKELAIGYSLPLPGRKPGEPVVLARTNLRLGERAAFALQPGGLYGPVPLDSSRFLIIKLLKINPAEPEAFDSIASRVRADLVRAKSGAVLEKLLERVVHRHSITVNHKLLVQAEVLEGAVLVRKSHFPNRYAVPFTTPFNHRAPWCRHLFSGN